jgi:hypothetical protein
MMPSLLTTGVGAPYNHASSNAYAVDSMLNELARQLASNTRRYSRTSNSHQRTGSAMKISKPGSANNSPRSTTIQARRRTLIGGLHTQSPALEQPLQQQPSPAETPFESTRARSNTTRAPRPVSWHPSSSQQSLFFQDSTSNTMMLPYSAYELEALATLSPYPPTPMVYSGYASPVESFSPLSLPYSNFSQPMCSPMSQPLPTPQQQPQQVQQQPSPYTIPCSANYASGGLLSEAPCLPPPQVADDGLCWDSYVASTTSFNRPTAPPTPDDFVCSVVPKEQQHEFQQQQTELAEQSKQEQAPTQQPCQPAIHDDEADEEEEGEILYGMGLYDTPDHSKGSVVLSLLGGARDEGDTGKGLGLKLEDAWEPPASDDEEEEEEGEEEQEEEKKDE